MGSSPIDLGANFLNLPPGFELDDVFPVSETAPTNDASPADQSSAHIQFVMNNLEGGDKTITDNNGAKARWGVNQKANPDVDLSKLTSESTESLYRDRYWSKIKGDKLPAEMQLPAIAFAANAGPAQTNKLIARSDGDVGKFLQLQKNFYHTLAQKPQYAAQLSGWMNRLDKVQKAMGDGTQYASADTGTQTDATYDNGNTGLPHGFELDAPDTASGSTGLPPGFELDTSSPDLPGLAGVPNLGQPPAPPAADAGPQVPIYGSDGNPIPPKAASPTDNLMLAGRTLPPDFMERTVADWKGRNQQLADINQNDYTGNQSVADTLYQTGGNLLGRGVDLGMNAAGSLGRMVSFGSPDLDGKYNLTDITKQGVGAVGEGVAPYSNPAFKDTADFVKSSPLLQRNLSATNDYAMGLPLLKPAGELLGAVDSGIVGAGRKIADTIPERAAPKAPIPTGDELAADSSTIYKSLPADAEALDAPSVDKFASDISAKAPQTRAGKIVAGDNALTKIVDRIAGKVDAETGERVGGLKGQPMTMAEAQEVDEALGDHIDDLTDGTTGRLTKQGKKVLDIQTAFRKAIQETGTEGGDQLALARAKFAQASRMRDVERINARAELMENPITARKTGYRNLYLRLQKNSMGYSPQEIALVKRAADSGIATNVLKLMGSRLGPLMAGAAGTATGGVLGGMAAYGTDYAISGAARGAANKIHLGRDTAVKRAIAERPMPAVRPQAAAEEAVPEALAAPKQITFQPDILAGQGAGAVARPATGAEMVAAEAGRQRNTDLGITSPPKPAAPETPVALSPINAALADNTTHPHPDYSGLTFAEADAIAQSRPNNYDYNNNTKQDKAYDDKMAAELYGSGAAKKERRIDIVMGPPGAGKSTALVDPLLKKHGAILIDSDEVKPKLPGFDHGLGANQVHERSKWITDGMPNSVTDRALNAGDNVVLPVVGKDLNSMQSLIDKWHKEGYNVNVHLADVPTEESIKRVIDRFGRSGRTVPLSYVQSIGDKPRNVFDRVTKGEQVNEYSHYNTNVPYGQEPKLIRASSNGVREDILGSRQRNESNGRSGLGKTGSGTQGTRNQQNTLNETQRASSNGVREDILGSRHDVGSERGGNGSSDSGIRGQTGDSQGSQPEIAALSKKPPIKIHTQGKPDIAITPTGGELNVRHAIVEGKDIVASQLDDLRHNPDYPQVLQPRDRTTYASQQQIAKLANDLKPRLLMDNPLSSEGAPIISKDGVVESGNGRTLAIRKAYAENPEGAEKYKQALRDAGYKIDGVEEPILVRIRETPMTGEERIKLAQDSNVRTTAPMSATEQAAQDAGKISTGTLSKFTGGDIKLLRNKEFAKALVKDIIPDSEHAGIFDKSGNLTQEGERRVNNALLSKAYGDKDISRLLTENTDHTLSSLGKALTHAAPIWARMREAAGKGSIPKNMDITPAIVKAVKLIQEARHAGKPLSDYFRMDDMFNGKVDQRLGMIIRNLHTNNELTRFKSADKITKILTDYARKAEQTKPGVNLFGEEPVKPDDVLESTFKEGDNDDETSGP